MNQDSVTVNRIDWLRSFPILQLSKALRMGFRLRTFLPCLLVSACFIISSFSISEVELSIDDDHWTVFSSPLSLPAPLSHVSEAVGSLGPNCPKPVAELLYGCAAYLLITTFLGITVARSTATEFCTATRTGAIQSLLFTAQHILSGLAAVTIMCLLASVPVVLLWLFGKIAIGIGTADNLEFAIFTKSTRGNINRISGGYESPEEAASNAAGYARTLQDVKPRMFIPSYYR